MNGWDCKRKDFMSRIHDALKRAEQERTDSAIPTSGAEASEGTHEGGEHLAGSQPALGTERLAMPLRPGSEEVPDSSALLKTLTERCPQSSWKPDPKTVLFWNGGSHALGTEEFRTLRSHLNLIRDRQPLKKVLVTSPLPREGKTFVAVNLAQVIVQQRERRVLLIDADLRRSQMHLMLGAPLEPGLSDYLRGDVDGFSFVKRGQLENLFFIPGGRHVSNASELLGNGRLNQLLHQVAPVFDWIILDSPPAIPVSDSRMIADVCDGVLVVIQAGTTPFDLAQKACQEFRDRRILGVVLNRVEARLTYNSYYYYEKGKGTKRNGEKG